MNAVVGRLPVNPFYQASVNAGSTCQVDYSSRDFDNSLEAPTTLEYRIDNLTDDVVIATWTNVPTPATQGNITISSTVNVMSTTYRDRQLNQVTFRATYADGSQVQDMAFYSLCAVLQA